MRGRKCKVAAVFMDGVSCSWIGADRMRFKMFPEKHAGNVSEHCLAEYCKTVNYWKFPLILAKYGWFG